MRIGVPPDAETGTEPWWSNRWFVAFVLAVGYMAGSEAAFRFADATGLQAVFFIPSGITLAALVRTHRSNWWILLLAVAAAELAQDLRSGLSVALSAGFVLAMIGALVDRSIGGHDLLTTLGQWWLGDALGVLLVGGPLLAIGSGADRRPLWSVSGALLLGGAVALTTVVLTASDLPLMFMVLTGVVVAGARFGVRGVSYVAAIVALTTAVVFLVGDGAIMVGVSDATGLVVIKLKFLVFTMGGLVVAAEMYERDLITIEQARLQVAAAEEHRLVARFQRLSLPPSVVIGRSFTAEGRYVAASSGLGVGGDWYDVAELPDGRVYICVGDVVGHGAEAAVTMSQLRVAMSILARHVDRPSDLLEQADLAAAGIPGASCSTAWVGFFDPRTGSLAYASAGHPPGFLLAADGIRRLGGSVAAPLTVRLGAVKPEAVVDVPADASLVLYTDGLVDRRGATIDAQLDDVERRLGTMWSSPTGFDLDALETFAGRTDDTVILHVALRPVPRGVSPTGPKAADGRTVDGRLRGSPLRGWVGDGAVGERSSPGDVVG